MEAKNYNCTDRFQPAHLQKQNRRLRKLSVGCVSLHMRRTLVLAMHSYTGVCTFTFLAAVIQMQKRKCLQVSGLCKIRITIISEEWHGCQMVGKQRRKKHPGSILRARSAQMQLATSQYSFNIAITEVRYSTKTLYRYSQRSRDYRRYSALAEECSTTF